MLPQLELLFKFPLWLCSLLAHRNTLLCGDLATPELFVFLLLSFKSSLYILDYSLFIRCLYFLTLMPYLVILLRLSFTEQKFLISVKSGISLLNFMVCAFDAVCKKSLPYQRLSRFSPMLFSMSVIVSHFTFIYDPLS